MADTPRNSVTRTNNRGRNCHRDNCVNGPTNNVNFQDYVGAETITIRNSNRSSRSNGRRGGNGRNRISSSNVRNRFERMQHRRFDPSFNTRVLQSSVGSIELNGESSENNEDVLQISSDNNLNSSNALNQQTSTSTKSNNNIGSLMNRNFPSSNENDAANLQRLPPSTQANVTVNGIPNPAESDVDEEEHPPSYHYADRVEDGTSNVLQAPGNARWLSPSPRDNARGSGIRMPCLPHKKQCPPVYHFTKTYTRWSDPGFDAQLAHFPTGNIDRNSESPQSNENASHNKNFNSASMLNQQSSTVVNSNKNIRHLLNGNFVNNSQDGASAANWDMVRLPTPPLENEENGILSTDVDKKGDTPTYHLAKNCDTYTQQLYNLPKQELNLSPTRIPASSSSVANSNEAQQTSGSTTAPNETLQGATSSNFYLRVVPSTSNSSEPTGVIPRAITKRQPENPDSWIYAPEFHPKSTDACKPPPHPTPNLNGGSEVSNLGTCPLSRRGGDCRLLPYCPFMHGETCDLCNCTVLHPTDIEQRMQHRQQCLERHEKNMELSFAIARSKEKTCGICFEVVLEKESYDRRFGILNQCNHCFCLTCIRRWRQARQFEHKVVKACPECRVTSDFVCPSQYWVETKEEKEVLIESYKKVLANKACKYFKQGRGVCPFGNKCFYLHALPDGTKTDVGPPRRRNNNRSSLEERMFGDLSRLMLWDISTDFEHHWLYSLAEDVEDLAAFFSDSDDSDGVDYEFFFQ